jgi:hypothetical protein
MTIYPDSSFLVSWLYKPDPLNKDQLTLATARGFRSARFY